MTWEEVRPKLAPLLRTPTTFGCSPEMTPDKRPIQRPFAPFLIECVGVDSDDGIAYVFAQVLDRWGVTVAEVFEAATENGHAYFTDDVEPYDAQAPYPIGTSRGTTATSPRGYWCPAGWRPSRARSRAAPWPSSPTDLSSSWAATGMNAASGV